MKTCINVLIILLAFFIASANAGVVIGGTRIIYNESDKETSISINNTEKSESFLIQSWLEGNDSSKKTPFIVTPPLFRINADEENLLRIVLTNDILPKDRESVFWLNVKTIPLVDESKSDTNVLQVVVKSRIKLFYRPKGLEGSAAEAFQKITVHHSGNELQLTNPTPYYATLSKLLVDGHEIKEADMIPPKSTVNFTLPSTTVSRVSWQAINDYGGISNSEQRTL